MADRDPKELHEAQTFETIEMRTPSRPQRKAKRKKLFAALAGGVALIGGGYYGYNALVASEACGHRQRLCRRRRGAGDAAGRRRRSARCSSRTRSRCAAATCWCGSTIPTPGSRSPAPRRISPTATRKVRGLVATDSGLGAQIAARAADEARASAQIASAQADLEKARIDLQRREDAGSVGRGVAARS